MLEPIRTALTKLSAISPDLPWCLLALGLFLLVYAVRKFAPALWLAFEARSPFLPADPEPVLVALHKLYQALPSAFVGLVLPAVISGGDWRKALAGALVGLLPPVMHELAKWAPFLPYRGAVEARPKAPMLLLLLFVVPLSGCSSWKPIARTADGVAEALCAQYFGEKQKLSLEDAARQFCATRRDLDPWIDAVLAAKRNAGPQAAALHP